MGGLLGHMGMYGVEGLPFSKLHMTSLSRLSFGVSVIHTHSSTPFGHQRLGFRSSGPSNGTKQALGFVAQCGLPALAFRCVPSICSSCMVHGSAQEPPR